MDPYVVSLLVSVTFTLGLFGFIISLWQLREKRRQGSKSEPVSIVDAWTVSSSFLSTVFSVLVVIFGPDGHVVGYVVGPFVVIAALLLVIFAHRKS